MCWTLNSLHVDEQKSKDNTLITPQSHEFNLENKTNVIRFMSHTGG